MRAGGQLGGRNVHAELLEPEGVQLGRQAEIIARPWQHFRPDELHILRELRFQLCDWFHVAGDLELLEQLLDAVDEEGSGAQVLLHLEPAGRQERCLREPRARLVLGQRHHARILAHPLERRRPPLGRDLHVEQRTHVAEDQPR